MNKQDEKIIAVLDKLVEHYGEQNWWPGENWAADGVSMILIQQSTQENVEKVLANLAPFMTLDI